MKYRSFSSLGLVNVGIIAIGVFGLEACTQSPDPATTSGGVIMPRLLYAPPQTNTTTCLCVGSGPDGPVTVNCGESACGSDYITYACSESGWSWTGVACGGTGDAGGSGGSTGSSCQCSGTGPGGVPVTVDCGQEACGSDYTTYACSVSGWSWTGVACTGGTGGAGGSGGSTGSSCQCSGTGPGGVPVTVDCGQEACGSDYTTYACSVSGWSWTGVTCTGGTGGAGGSGGSTGSCCQCSGTGPGGVPVTVDCGQEACGSDYTTYACSVSGWSWTGVACTGGTGGAGGSGGSTGSSCQCTGTGPGGVPVTVDCGQEACGSDYTTYACSVSGWSWTGVACTGGTGGAGGSGGSTGTGGATSQSPGCGKTSTIPSEYYNNGTAIPITAAGQQRRYVINVPTNYVNTTPYKLVLAFHELNGNDKEMYNQMYYDLLPLSNNTVIFVAPNGTSNGTPCSGIGSGDSGCGWANAGGKDIALMDAIVAQIEENFCVDTNEIFATGWSYGASMAYEVGCQRPLGGTGGATWGVRAIAIYSGARLSGTCVPTTPIGYYASHGTQDSVLNYNGGVTLAQTLANVNGCAWATPTRVTSGAHVCTNEAGCGTGYPVEFCSFNGEHTPYPDTGQASSSWGPQAVWNFLSQF